MYNLPNEQHGHVDGFVSGNLYSFTWKQPSNGRHGSSKVAIAADGMSMEGDWFYDPDVYGGHWTFRREGSNPELAALQKMFGDRLARKRFFPVPGEGLLQWGFVCPASGLWPTWAMAAVDARSGVESPDQVWESVSGWFNRATGGRQGNGLLLFVCKGVSHRLAKAIQESHFVTGGVPVGAGYYDMQDGDHWVPSDWQTQLFD